MKNNFDERQLQIRGVYSNMHVYYLLYFLPWMSYTAHCWMVPMYLVQLLVE